MPTPRNRAWARVCSRRPRVTAGSAGGAGAGATAGSPSAASFSQQCLLRLAAPPPPPPPGGPPRKGKSAGAGAGAGTGGRSSLKFHAQEHTTVHCSRSAVVAFGPMWNPEPLKLVVDGKETSLSPVEVYPSFDDANTVSLRILSSGSFSDKLATPLRRELQSRFPFLGESADPSGCVIMTMLPDGSRGVVLLPSSLFTPSDGHPLSEDFMTHVARFCLRRDCEYGKGRVWPPPPGKPSVVKPPTPGTLLTIEQELDLAVAEDELEAEVVTAVLASGAGIKAVKPQGDKRTRRKSLMIAEVQAPQRTPSPPEQNQEMLAQKLLAAFSGVMDVARTLALGSSTVENALRKRAAKTEELFMECRKQVLMDTLGFHYPIDGVADLRPEQIAVLRSRQTQLREELEQEWAVVAQQLR